MAQPEKKSAVTPASLLVDAILVGAFFVLMFVLFKHHVPSNDPKMVTLWAGLSAACISGVLAGRADVPRRLSRAKRSRKIT